MSLQQPQWSSSKGAPGMEGASALQTDALSRPALSGSFSAAAAAALTGAAAEAAGRNSSLGDSPSGFEPAASSSLKEPGTLGSEPGGGGPGGAPEQARAGEPQPLLCSPDSGRALVLDLPWRQQLRFYAPQIVLWVLLEVASALAVAKQVCRGRAKGARASRRAG